MISQNCNCELRIWDQDRNTQFDYEDTIGVDIVMLKGTQLVAEIYTSHDNNLQNEVYIPLGNDGYYELIHLTLPNFNWYQKELKKNKPFYHLKDIYISDCKNIYKVENGKFNKVDIKEFTFNIDLDHSTVTKKQKPYFFTCYLWKCYIHYCKLILDKVANKEDVYQFINCGDCLDSIKDLIYKRNFLWATINVLNNLVDECRYEEAQKILDKVQSCRGFCFSVDGRKINIFKWRDYNNNNSTGVILDSGCNCN